MNEQIDAILAVLDGLRVDGMSNFERLVYVKLLLEQLKENEKEE